MSVTEKTKSILSSAGLVVLTAGFAALVTFLTGGSLKKILGVSGFTAVIIIIGLLKSNYRQVDRAIESFFAKYFLYTFWLLVTLAPTVLFNWLSRFTLESAPVLQAILFVLWGAILTAVLMLIATARRREKLFQFLERVGVMAPFVYCLNAFVIAALFFATLTYLMAEFGTLTFTNPDGVKIPATALSVDRLMEFFIWHFLDAVPLLKVNKTLSWEMEITYSSSAVGFIVLVFKIGVIIPVISAFRGYWKHRQSRREGGEE